MNREKKGAPAADQGEAKLNRAERPAREHHRRWLFLLVDVLLLAAIVAAVIFLVSLLTIKTLLGFVRRHTFTVFGIYRILLGIAVLLVLL